MRVPRLVASISAAVLMVGLGTTGAYANSNPNDNGGYRPQTVVVSGHILGPKDGLEVDYDSFEIIPGGGSVGKQYSTTNVPGQVTPNLVWGTSYAYSNEIFYVTYKGYGKAAANVYNGKRIVEVCFWWTRAPNYVTSKTCSDANFNGGWVQGPEKIGFGYDTLDSNAPPTIFNISTVRIDPSAHW